MSTHQQPAVELEEITKRFGTVVANDGVDFTLETGTVHALLGENGSGKTTLMNILYGLYERDSGTIRINGESREFDSPRDAIDDGIGMIHQHFQLVEPMTVLQNIILGHEPTQCERDVADVGEDAGRAERLLRRAQAASGQLRNRTRQSTGIVNDDAAREDVREICERYGFGLEDDLDTPVRELDIGAQQHVEIVKSLYRGAEILILDEPTAVLTPQEVEGLLDVMEKLTADGHSLIFITHKLDEAMEAADDITVLRDGTAIDTVDADQTSREELARLMVGREVLFESRERTSSMGDTVLDVKGLTVTGDRGFEQVRQLDFSVRNGEILGIAGVQGNGQTELVEVLTGLRPVDAGTIRFDGDDITSTRRRELIDAGIAYIPEDRQTEGLVQDYDLVRNAYLGYQTDDSFTRYGFTNWDVVGDHTDDIIETYDVQPGDPSADAASLSGGNQQKFVVGREIGHDPDVMVASHPTRGVDIGSIEFIHERLREMRDDGMALVLVSSKLEEVQQLSDRIAVMYEGEFVDIVDPDAVSEQDLGLLMAGNSLDETSSASGGGSA